MKIVMGRRSQNAFSAQELLDMHRLRHDVFRDRLQWAVNTEDGCERDGFDELDPVYMIVKGDDDRVCGCWRLLPSMGPYMMKDTFPQTLQGHSAPTLPTVWELSRFALSQHCGAAHRFCDLALAMMEAVVAHGLREGIDCYVTVTTTAIERLMRGLGIRMQRMGEPVQIGIEKTVALRLAVDHATWDQLRLRRQATAEPMPLAA